MSDESDITFTVPGDPKGKARPKFRRFGKFTMAYTPKATVEYEDKVRKSFKDSVDKDFKPLEGPIEAEAICVFSIPSSVSKKKRQSMIGQPVLKKPDTDNIIKSILDPLNGVAYGDDSQVCKLSGLKIYGEVPRVDVTIREYRNTIQPIYFIPPWSEDYEYYTNLFKEEENTTNGAY